MQAKERLYLARDGKTLVREGDAKGSTLYAAPGDEIPESAVELFGLVDGTIKSGRSGAKERAPGQDKEKAPGPNKEKAPGEDKEKAPGEDKGDDLAQIKGVGAKTAAALTAAGYTSFASVAVIDAANPPAVEGLPAVFKWADVVASAKEQAAAEGTGA